MAKPYDFVNKGPEILYFDLFVSRKVQERVVVFSDDGLRGKTYLILYLHAMCQDDHKIKNAKVDFDSRYKGKLTYEKFVFEICEQIGWGHFPLVADALKQQISFPHIKLAETQPSISTLEFGTKNQIEDSRIEKIAARDQVNIENFYYEAVEEGESKQDRRMEQVGRSLKTELEILCSSVQIVLFLDTFDQISDETRQWFEEWVLDGLLEKYPNLLIVIAGRPNKIREFLSSRRPWQTLMLKREELTQFKEDDIKKYIKISTGVDLQGGEILPFKYALRLGDMETFYRLRDIYKTCGRQLVG